MKARKPTIARERVAGEAEHERGAAAAEPQRLARLDAHAPEDLLDAARLERGLDVVVRADRDAAGDDEHVARQAGLDGGAGGLEVVADHAVVDRPRRPPRSASSRTIRPLDSWILPGSGGAPSGSSSLPVTRRCSARRGGGRSPRRRRRRRAS